MSTSTDTHLSVVERAKALPSEWFQNTGAKLDAYVGIVSELVATVEAQAALNARETGPLFEKLADILAILMMDFGHTPLVKEMWSVFWKLKMQVAPEAIALVPDCHICHLPMTFQGQGYSTDHQGDVALFYCENVSVERPTGCATQARKRVKPEVDLSTTDDTTIEETGSLCN